MGVANVYSLARALGWGLTKIRLANRPIQLAYLRLGLPHKGRPPNFKFQLLKVWPLKFPAALCGRFWFLVLVRLVRLGFRRQHPPENVILSLLIGFRHVKTRRPKINAKTLTAIGRLMRACAELEDILALHLSTLVSVSESQLTALIGRSPMSSVRSAALYLSKLHSAGAHETHKAMFDARFSLLFQIRNTLAHGVYMGRDAEGRYAFLTSETLEPEGEAAVKLVRAYSEEDIIRNAYAAEAALPKFETMLGLEKLRRRRFEQPLLDNPPGRGSKRKASKPPRPPQS